MNSHKNALLTHRGREPIRLIFASEQRHYRFAAALANTPRDVATFDGLAAMFDQIACRFRRAEMRLARLQSSTVPPSQPHQKAQ
jgi:hypothetical protein